MIMVTRIIANNHWHDNYQQSASKTEMNGNVTIDNKCAKHTASSPEIAQLSREREKHKSDARTFCSFVLILNNKWFTASLLTFIFSPLQETMFLRMNRIIFIANHKKIYYPFMSPASSMRDALRTNFCISSRRPNLFQ